MARRAPWWLRLMRRLPLLSVVARRLFGAGTSSQLLLTNVAAETQTRLRAMGLSSRVVPSVTGDDATGAARPLTAGEMGNACRLSDGRYAASFSLLTPPARTDPGWLDRLVNLPGPYRLAVWAHGTDPNRERTRLSTRNRQTGLHLLTASAGVGEKSAQFTEAEEAMMRLRQPNQAMIKAGGLCDLYRGYGRGRDRQSPARRARHGVTGARCLSPIPARGVDAAGPGRGALLLAHGRRDRR